MKKDTVVSLKKPVEEAAPLTSLLRDGAQQLLYGAVEAELARVSVPVPGRAGCPGSPVHR